jgi:transcriptional regulator with XRE-family HTH domain
MANNVKIHKVLKSLMEEQGLTTAKLSKITGIPNSTLASYLSDLKASYNPSHLLMLAEHFQVSLEYLLTSKVSSSANLKSLPLEKIFSGYLKVNIERVIQIDEED